MTTKKELEARLKKIESVGKLALKVWRAGAENDWKSTTGYITILMQIGDHASGKKKLPSGYIKDLRRQAKEYIDIRHAAIKARLEKL